MLHFRWTLSRTVMAARTWAAVTPSCQQQKDENVRGGLCLNKIIFKDVKIPQTTLSTITAKFYLSKRITSLFCWTLLLQEWRGPE